MARKFWDLNQNGVEFEIISELFIFKYIYIICLSNCVSR